MALQYKDSNGVDRYLKIARVAHLNNLKMIRIICGIGSVPVTQHEFIEDDKVFYELGATGLRGDSLPAAYDYLKSLSEYKGSVDI